MGGSDVVDCCASSGAGIKTSGKMESMTSVIVESDNDKDGVGDVVGGVVVDVVFAIDCCFKT